MANHRLKVLLHPWWQIRARLQEVLEVRCRKGQHLARAVVTQEVVALVQLDGAGPVLEVSQFFLGLLREQVVGDANGQLFLAVQLLDDGIIVRIVLETTAGVDRTGQAETIEFA
jgi:hypothetical protein